jgi:lipopolysaccharide biosynthesis protein
MMGTITVLMHIYYPGSWKRILDRCRSLLEQANNIIITVCHEDVVAELRAVDATVLRVTNVGKDIGGKLTSMYYYLTFCEPTDYVAFIHDKTSPQTINPEFWFDKLLAIFEHDRLPELVQLFNSNKQVGVAGSKFFLKNEYSQRAQKFNTTNNNILQKLIAQFGLVCKSYNYIGGTIFMARSNIFETFFSSWSPLGIRESLERGNVLDLKQGTYTHSWERMFCFIAENQGYKVVGV